MERTSKCLAIDHQTPLPVTTYSNLSRRHPAKPLRLTAFVLATALGGCTVGPNFVHPDPPQAAAYTSAATAPHLQPDAGEPAQRVSVEQAIPAAWWQLFRSPPLDRLVRQAIANSPTIAAAQARLLQSQQVVAEARGAYAPQIDASASAERQKGPPFALGIRPNHDLPTYSLYSAGATASFTPDVFGLTGRRVEQQQALAQNQAYQLAAAQLAVTGNVVHQTLTIAAARQQIAALDATVAADEKTLALVRQKYTDGKLARDDVLTVRAQLANDRALLPPMRQEVAVAQDALAILVGVAPASFSPPDFDLADFTLPAELPVGLPSALAERRPDILAAEARLHAASAAVGVADAQMYPSFTLSASVGTAALATSSLGGGSNLVWTLFGGITAPIFHGGALTAQKRAAIDQFHAELALYRQTVLTGLGQVADLLRSLGHDAERVQAERQALDATDDSLHLAQRRYALGKTGRLPLLDAERRDQQQRVSYVQVRAQRYLDSAQLFVALGGGWWRDAGAPDQRANPTRQPSSSAVPDRRRTLEPNQ
ncbi:efflux transporter outer membrane subunit [Pseudomonas kielensis]|uniref:Efflux transporter outer membrane subunit n=1 Tax=Pseudomonas kielensis TaxID=2762577 RepID=A0A7X1GJB0_9PSED|nr:efflux transporter outer membrane subunit [Pseudomonas kielensis]MBC2693479.1 efflux transporter outer membrane subunit [Pseudomonas kielensis]